MLNFLRKLRRGNTKAGYIKYALGEIILVVIGILIAVNINNWNEERKERVKERQLLVKLQKENEYNTASLVNDSSYHNNVDMISYTLHRALSAERSAKNDSIIEQKLVEGFRSSIFTFSSKYLERYINNSDIMTDGLVEDLVELKDAQNNLNQISQMVFDYKFDKIFGYLEPYFDSYEGKIDDIESLRTRTFINRIVTLDNLEESQVDIYQDCLELHLRLDSLLKKRLEE